MGQSRCFMFYIKYPSQQSIGKISSQKIKHDMKIEKKRDVIQIAKRQASQDMPEIHTTNKSLLVRILKYVYKPMRKAQTTQQKNVQRLEQAIRKQVSNGK